jgi:hypothetical protein
MPRLASCTSLGLPLERMRTTLPLLVTRSLLPLLGGVLMAALCGATEACAPAPPALNPRAPIAVLFVEGRTPAPPAVGPLVAGWLADGPLLAGWLADGPAALGPWVAPPPELPDGLEEGAGRDVAAGLAGAGVDAGFLVSAAAAATAIALRSAPRMIALNPILRVFRLLGILIKSSFLAEFAPSRLHGNYSTLLTFPLVKVTFMSL